jgi:hypothetical protein
VQRITERFSHIRVGLHDDIDVVLGASWHGAVPRDVRVAQVFTSTLAAGGYGYASAATSPWRDLCRQLLRASYLGTLLGARVLERRVAVLTLIGGGVFGNPLPLIWDSILWAFDTMATTHPGALDVVVNGRNLAHSVHEDRLAEDARDRGGVALSLTRERTRVHR